LQAGGPLDEHVETPINSLAQDAVQCKAWWVGDGIPGPSQASWSEDSERAPINQAGALPRALLSVGAALILTALIELWMGRSIFGPDGRIGLWEGNTQSSECSQRLFDPYSFSHVEHGILFYAALWLLFRKWPVWDRFRIALLLEAAWEVFENSPIIIRRYREATIALGYDGDSVLNSVSDILMMVAGFVFARRVRPSASIALLLVMELACAFWIRDNLALNIVMLVHPIQAVKQWQSGAEAPVLGQPRSDLNSQRAHAQLLEKARRGRIDVYFAGDSITRRWGATDPQFKDLLDNWTQNFYGWNAADFGWGGDTVQNVLWRLQNGELDSVNPKIIVLMAGTNNLQDPAETTNGEAKVEEVVRGLGTILSVMQQKAPHATIIIMGITPRRGGDKAETIRQINDRISRLADGKRVRYLNINGQLADRTGQPLEGMTTDGLHLTIKAYQIWADALKPIFRELLGPPAQKDLAPPPTGDPRAQPPPGAP
jgi:lysophospholipase L1-like esterase